MPSSTKTSYLSLIEDTLTHLKRLLPPGQKAPSPPPLKKPKTKTASLKKVQKQEPPKKLSPPHEMKKKQKEPPPPLKQGLFSLTPPSPPLIESLEDMRKTFQEIDPHFPLKSTIPSDKSAKQIREKWKEKKTAPAVSLLIHEEASSPFFSNLAEAISISFCPAQVISLDPLEKKNQWNSFLEAKELRLIITPDAALFGSKHLLHHYREIPSEKKRFLKDVPLLLLPDPSLYMKDPTLKQSLWHLIKKALS